MTHAPTFSACRTRPAAVSAARSTERRTGARLIVSGLAMRMMVGEADSETLPVAVIATQEALGPEDGLTRLVTQVARDWPMIRLDPAALRERGDALWRQVIRSSWPQPSTRADLEG